MADDFDTLMDLAIEQGFQHRLTEKGHHQLFAPDGHTIVVTSGTPGDYRAYDNFLAELKRAGYDPDWKPPPKANGEDHVAKIVQKRLQMGLVSNMLMEIFQANPARMHAFNDLKDVVSARLNTKISLSVMYNNLSRMTEKRFIKRLSKGVYQWAGAKPDAVPAPPAIWPSTPLPTGSPPPVMGAAGQRLGDDALDAELDKLDRALAAIADIESVIRRVREVVGQMAELKKSLTMFGAK